MISGVIMERMRGLAVLGVKMTSGEIGFCGDSREKGIWWKLIHNDNELFVIFMNKYYLEWEYSYWNESFVLNDI